MQALSTATEHAVLDCSMSELNNHCYCCPRVTCTTQAAQAESVSVCERISLMGSVGDDHKCPLCGRVGNGGYAVDWLSIGPICTGTKFASNCLQKVVAPHNLRPNEIVAKALKNVLCHQFQKRYPSLILELVIVPWLICD